MPFSRPKSSIFFPKKSWLGFDRIITTSSRLMRRPSVHLTITVRNWRMEEMSYRIWSTLKSSINQNYCSTSNVGTSAILSSLTVVIFRLFRPDSCHYQSLCLHQWSLQRSSFARVSGLCLPWIFLVQNASASYLWISCFLSLAAVWKLEESIYRNQWGVRCRQNLEYKILSKVLGFFGQKSCLNFEG